jgi:hypothetical protein
MRSADLNRLRAPYNSPRDMDLQFALALGIDISMVEELFRKVFGDLDETVFGIGWWAPHLGTKRSILISHYLVDCIKNISTNHCRPNVSRIDSTGYRDRPPTQSLE